MKRKKLLIPVTCIVFILLLLLVANIFQSGTNVVQNSQKFGNAGKGSERKQLKNIQDITFVTAFFNLGNFRKGTENRHVEDYLQWMKSYRRLNFPVVFYTDDADFLYKFTLVRKYLSNLTQCHLMDRRSLQSFHLEPKIRAIFRQPHYPVHYPNTVLPEYSCTMHAKYELLDKAMSENAFGSEYFAWADLGGYRQVNEHGALLNFEFPPGFNDRSIAVAEIEPMINNITHRIVIEFNLVSVAGTFLLGHTKVLKKFVENYQNQVEELLSNNLMSTDQQVIYTMYSKPSNDNVPLKTYSGEERHCEPWFHLMLLVVNHPCEYFNPFIK